ncbi:MAG: hypothetical protein U9P80_06645, partial [Thermodesulfobacteriota bacterium]|nr:hypothetical protein [Thermodesulfobacteriota bacterium]
SLQFHDIVDQDLQVINKGIQEIKQHQDTDEFFAFENRFNTLSMEIIKELLSTSRDRAEEIEQEFHTIENIVVQIKEDTEQIAGLILFGLRGKSTLEFLEIETSDTLKENASRLMAIFASRDRIASTIYALKKKRSQMTTSGAGPEKTDSDQALRHALAMVCPDDTVRTYAPKTLDIKNLVHLSEKTDDETIAGLREIKGILGDCVKAINEYADSAQKYISIFKEDLQAISDTICSKGDEATLDNKFMLAAESSIKKHGALHTDIINITYIRIISRLSDPHINSIINKDRKMPETGENFTLF